MYVPKYFTVDECFPPHLVRAWGRKAWGAMDERILMAGDRLRKRYGPMWVNGHGFTQCGYRTHGSDGNKLSPTSRTQHRFGRALDLHPMDCTPQEIRKDIYAGRFSDWTTGIAFVETDISWLHIDCRNSYGLQFWSPKRDLIFPGAGDPIDV